MPSILTKLLGGRHPEPEAKTDIKPETNWENSATATNEFLSDHINTASEGDLSLATQVAPGVGLKGPRLTRFFSYYRNHIGVLAADLGCAVLVSATALALPLCANFIIKRLSTESAQADLLEIFRLAKLRRDQGEC